MEHLLASLDLIARGGGGGSSGSGGGGGAEIIALIGYFPSYYLGKIIKKLLPRKLELIVSATFAVLFSIVLLVLGAAFKFLGLYFTILIVIGIWLGWGAAFFGLWERLKKRSKKAKADLQVAAQTDAAWNEEALMNHARTVFMQYQYDWSTLQVMDTVSYTTPAFARHNTLLLAVLNELGRKNIMANVQIKQSLLVDIHDDPDNTRDSYLVAFEASALDQLVANDGTVLFSDSRPFVEYWRFTRSGSTWLLSDIIQQTQDLSAANQSIQQFATANNMYYSLDMGWLFLPTRGVLMSLGKMGQSDINNHVVGTYNGHLVQLYTYTPSPQSNSSRGSNSWLVLQLTLPKSYEGILVQPASKNIFNTSRLVPPKAYQKQTFEWADFNKRYNVYATNADRLAAFELINPGFMAYFYDNDPGAGIEVADNVLYLFKPLGPITSSNVDPNAYTTMLTIAMKAFKELQL